MMTDVRLRVAAVLGLVAAVALVSVPAVGHLAGALVAVVALDSLLGFIRQRVWYLSPAAVVTGLIIGLVLDPRTPFSITALTALAAVASKHLITVAGRHIFNPAGFGLIISALLLGGQTAWWAAAWPSFWIRGILLLGMGAILFRLRRLALPLGFLLVYFLYGGRLGDGTVLFFSLVMLPEIKTSPATGHWRWTFGPLVAAIYVVILLAKWPIPVDPLVLSLLVANLTSCGGTWALALTAPKHRPQSSK